MIVYLVMTFILWCQIKTQTMRTVGDGVVTTEIVEVSLYIRVSATSKIRTAQGI